MRAVKFWATSLLLLVTFQASLAGERAGGDWPIFLGPNGTGVSTETGLIDGWGADGPKELWSCAIGTGYGAPSVRGDVLVLHHRLKDAEVVEAFSATNGQPIWRYEYPSSFIDPYGYNNGPRCTPLLTPDRCYTYGAEGKLLCLELKTGKLVWQRDTASDWKVPQAFFGVGSSPILEGNLLIVMVGGQPDSGVVAFNAATGGTVWESVGAKNWQGAPMVGWPGERLVQWRPSEKQASYASPVAVTINGRRHILCLMRQGLVSVDPERGAVNFSFWFRSQLNDSVNAANPIVVSNMIFISGAYYRVGSVLLRVKPDNRSVEEVWRSTALELHWNTPIYDRGYLYAFSGRNEPDARFRCVEFQTGKVSWDRDESWSPHSSEQPPVYGRGSSIMAEGKLIVLGEGGLLGLFRVNPNKAEELARHQVKQLTHPCWAAPVLARQRLFLRSEKQLVCLDLAKGIDPK